MNNLDEKYRELKKLELSIEEIRNKLHHMLMNSIDPLDDDVLALSKTLDKMISRYTTLKMELKDH
ncbi:MAG: Spo0E family sporulation regulatory protein-aspartic acid phosphatase [Clostridiales bacterium]|nr:Spo0E family sporulation regulatory protein-aspartic acid phosphatase [Clostridiales bacterium]